MPDATLNAITVQTQAMNAGVYEIGVLLPGDSPRMLLRTWEPADILKSAPWLKAKNMEGAAVYIRPFGEHRLSLIDDLTPETLTRLKSEGFQPCLVVQTSPNNYQAWLDHGRKLPKELSTAAARALAEKFGGDRGSADWRHFGRLAGLTNRKEKHRQPNNLFPYVRIIEATPGLIYDQAGPFVQGVERALEKSALAAAKAAVRSRVLSRGKARNTTPVKLIADFHADPRYAGDLNRADLAYTVYALGHGASEDSIRGALTSRDLTKKGGEARIEDYIKRTLLKAAEQINRKPSVPRLSNRVRELSR